MTPGKRETNSQDIHTRVPSQTVEHYAGRKSQSYSGATEHYSNDTREEGLGSHWS